MPTIRAYSSTNSLNTSIDASHEDTKTSIKYGNPSIDDSENEYETSTKPVYPSIETMEEDNETSIKTTQNVNPSIDVSAQTVNKTVANTIENDQEGEYIPVTGSFIDALVQLTIERDNNITRLVNLFHVDGSGIVKWVSLRHKCLVDCLLTFSEMKQTETNDLKEVCNAFTLLIQSGSFKSLPVIYPYIQEILQLKESLKQICMEATINNMQLLRFRLSHSKKSLIATSWELSHFVPKVSFAGLNFK